MCPIGPFGADFQVTQNIWAEDVGTVWLPNGRDRFGQGAMQVVGTFVSIAMGIAPAIVIGLLTYLTSDLSTVQVFNDDAFAELYDHHDEYHGHDHDRVDRPVGYVDRPAGYVDRPPSHIDRPVY